MIDMLIKNIIFEDIVNYKKTSMFIAFGKCSFKCDELNGCHVCQNSLLLSQPDINIENKEIIRRYMGNKLTHAVVCAGLEPLDQFAELISFIKDFREVSDDDIVIYTGYTESEVRLMGQYDVLRQHKNIVIKFGRFIINQPSHYDEVLGVELASPNQYAERIS